MNLIFIVYYFSTTYHLFLVSHQDELFMDDVFIFTNKKDAEDLALLVQPKDYVLAGVMNMESTSKLVWIAEHNLGEGADVEKILDFVNESLSHFTETFQDEWI
jgi:hypothetical protein